MIWGVDVNLRRVTAATLDPVRFYCWQVDKHLPSLECARWIAHEVQRTNWITGDDVVWIERPSGRAIKSVADLSRVMGAFVAAIPLTTSIEEVVPAEWKKLVGLPGNARKPVVMEWAIAELEQRCGRKPRELTEHEADALAIAVSCERESARYTESESRVIA